MSTIGINDEQRAELLAYLGDPNISFVVDEALVHVAASFRELVASLRHEVLPTVWRRPADLDNDHPTP